MSLPASSSGSHPPLGSGGPPSGAAAGVPVELELYRGLTHDFIKMGRVLKEAAHAQQAAADALRNAWNR